MHACLLKSTKWIRRARPRLFGSCIHIRILSSHMYNTRAKYLNNYYIVSIKQWLCEQSKEVLEIDHDYYFLSYIHAHHNTFCSEYSTSRLEGNYPAIEAAYEFVLVANRTLWLFQTTLLRVGHFDRSGGMQAQENSPSYIRSINVQKAIEFIGGIVFIANRIFRRTPQSIYVKDWIS